MSGVGRSKGGDVDAQHPFVPVSDRLYDAARRLFVASTAIWIVLMCLNSGITVSIFPASISIADGRLYIWASEFIDVSSTLMLASLLLFTYVGRRFHQRVRPISRLPNQGNLIVPPGLDFELKGNDPALSKNDSNPLLEILKAKGLRLSIAVALLVVIGMIANHIAFDRRSSHFSLLMQESAINLSQHGEISFALDATIAYLPRSFHESSFGAYYFASGWAQVLGATDKAARLDVQLIRASIALENPDGLVVGLHQYLTATNRPIRSSVGVRLLEAVTSPNWRRTVESSFAWQKSGDAARLRTNLIRGLKSHSSQVLLDYQNAISAVDQYESAN